ncbi:Secreted protein containing Cytochrome C, Planctomycete domain [Planctomycetales bacterium 10988]|nr:Secreted protein containing Cytochrome C, Planctomycete domain [Planctomycetales bacterium 10988]
MNIHRHKFLLGTIAILTLCCLSNWSYSAENVSYQEQIAPILNKYCVGCHSEDYAEGKLSLETYKSILKGGEHGKAISPNNAEDSLLIQVITGAKEPKMPPDDQEGPNQKELALLKNWINLGAPNTNSSTETPAFSAPSIAAADVKHEPITAISLSPKQPLLATGSFQKVTLRKLHQRKQLHQFSGLSGKVNQIEFSEDGQLLVAASGITGLEGQAIVWNVNTKEIVAEFRDHQDIIYAATISPDNKRLATAGYDRKIIIWDLTSGEKLKTLEGHNGSIFDLAFHPNGTLIASASADETVKIWHIDQGIRLDTLSQPEAEQYSVFFSPDGKFVYSAGADNRIRKWRVISLDRPRINPIRITRFAHEQPIVKILYHQPTEHILSMAEDNTVKLWDASSLNPLGVQGTLSQSIFDGAFYPSGRKVLLASYDGKLHSTKVHSQVTSRSDRTSDDEKTISVQMKDLSKVEEQEPNDTLKTAHQLTAPFQVTGVINSRKDQDVDLFSFHAKAGEDWIVEVEAERKKSSLDSKIEILDEQGNRVERVLLEAIRDSYFTFRGKTSDVSNDFRIHNWQEMKLNEFLYAGGEVVKLWRAPNGPDSGFTVYPGSGKRQTFFDTTPLAHALHAPCYVVKAHPPGTNLIPNGLPTFTLYYENDDERTRKLGKDSFLHFVPPQDGLYHVRLVDVRGFQGEDFHYQLKVRPRKPDFSIAIKGKNPKILQGSGRELVFDVKRFDDFTGPIQIEIDHLPPGFHVSSPLFVQAGQDRALAALVTTDDATAPTNDQIKQISIKAKAMILGKEVVKDLGNLGKIEFLTKSQLKVQLLSSDKDATPPSVDAPLELYITPGETITARVAVDRINFQNRVQFGKLDAGRNLPHAVYIDNIGLNGLLIPENTVERTFFITADEVAEEGTFSFHLRASEGGGITSRPAILHVVSQEEFENRNIAKNQTTLKN